MIWHSVRHFGLRKRLGERGGDGKLGGRAGKVVWWSEVSVQQRGSTGWLWQAIASMGEREEGGKRS